MRDKNQSDLTWLNHISESIEEIQEYTGIQREGLKETRLVQRAVERVLQTLAESTQRLTPELKATEPEIPWEEIAGLRNRLTHEYRKINQEIVRRVVEKELPQLAAAIQRMTERTASSEAGTWQEQMEREWPKYEFGTTAEGFTLTRQESPSARKEFLGQTGSIEDLCELERKHRGWPPESLSAIIAYTEEEIEQSKARTRG